MKKTAILFLFLSLLLTFPAYSQMETPRYRLRGKIVDARTNQVLKKFPVKVEEFKRTVRADEKGEFLFNMPQGNYTLVFDDYPFEVQELTITLSADTSIVVALQTTGGIHYLQEVEVVAAKPLTEKQASVSQINARELAALPAMIGERDLLKALSLTAGVSSSGEGAADMQVRGGLHGQNLFLLDNVPLYSTQHMFGMVSAFNPAIIKSADLYKAGFPAEYGGRIASVLDVKSKDANLNTFSGEGEISIIATKAAVNVPVIKNKLGVSLAGRISNYSLLNLVSFTGIMEGTRTNLHFADINANVFYRPNERDRLKLTFFHNSDALNVNQNDFTEYIKAWQGNTQQNIGLNWGRSISDQMSNQVHLYWDRYTFSYGGETTSKSSNEKYLYEITSSILSFGLEDKLSYRFSDKLNTDAGVSLKSYTFKPLNFNLLDTAFSTGGKLNNQFEGSLFAQTQYMFLPKQTLDMGLRFSAFGNGEKVYPSFEPRFSYHGIFANDVSLSASVSRMTQSIHRVANPGLGITMEIFQPSDKAILPEKSWIYSLGAAKDFKFGDQRFSVKADAWYKQIWNLVEFKDGYDTFSMILLQQTLAGKTSELLTQGNGKAYGIDFSANYRYKRVKFSADYTLMEARNRFDELNNGNWFAASTDIRHSLSLVAEVQLSKSWTFSATWQYRTGRPVTLPTAVYLIPEIDFGDGSVIFHPGGQIWDYESAFQVIETERNNARMRPFHKLDIAFNRTYWVKKKYEATLSLGLYNVYNRANPAYYFIGSERVDGVNYPVLKSISMFSILPAFSWGIKF